MKIVNTDNFGGDYPDEKFLTVGNNGALTFGKDHAQKIADALNLYAHSSSSRWWKVVYDDYELQPGFEP